MGHLVERGPSGAAHPAGRRVVGDQFRVLGFQGPKLHHKSVVVGIRDLRLVLGVVTLKVISHQGSKLVDPGRRVLHKPILPAARDGLRAGDRPVA